MAHFRYYRSAAAVTCALAFAACGNGTSDAPAQPDSAGAAQTLPPLDRDQRVLLDQTRQVAAKLLVQLGAFPPLAVALDAAGKPVLVSNDVDPSLQTGKKLAILISKLRALGKSGRIRSAGIVLNGGVTDDAGKRQDAVLISIEERAKPPAGFEVAYRFQGKRVAFAEPKPLAARPQVFAQH